MQQPGQLKTDLKNKMIIAHTATSLAIPTLCTQPTSWWWTLGCYAPALIAGHLIINHMMKNHIIIKDDQDKTE
ncbi:MAG TPA: hypothetical protein VHX42_00925 [Candidatus Babeliales bacterium]|jgi:hypothetical protein|nr:hypothetical protein [Candidatus Babeliales bacterium]